jgi:hypothetical protein
VCPAVLLIYLISTAVIVASLRVTYSDEKALLTKRRLWYTNFWILKRLWAPFVTRLVELRNAYSILVGNPDGKHTVRVWIVSRVKMSFKSIFWRIFQLHISIRHIPCLFVRDT